MSRFSIFGAIALSAIGVAVVAHNGATGVVLERMNGMSAMRDVMRDLMPMMQGQIPFDVRTVQIGAATLMAHSSENMIRLFPEEPIPDPSFARPEIWSDWDRFAILSDQLSTYAMGLAMAAPNGLTAPALPMAEGHAGMAMDETPVQIAPESEGFTVAELMGIAPPPPVPRRVTAETAVGNAMPAAQLTPIEDLVSGVDFSLMAAPTAFEMVGQTCAACHSQFRDGS